VKYCNKCGDKLLENKHFCRKCGTKIEVQTTAKNIPVTPKNHFTYFYIFIAILILALVFTSYQYSYFNKEYKTFYEKFKYEESEKQRYINLYTTEKQNKESEITLRRQKEVELADAQTTIQTKDSQIEQLRSVLSTEQITRLGLQNQLSGTQSTLNQKDQQLQVLNKDVTNIRNELNFVSTWIKNAAYISADKQTKITALTGSPITITGNTCIIDANKLGKDMNSKLGFAYEYKKIERTPQYGYSWYYDLDTFWLSKEGVCVDYAIFVSARLRTELQKAESLCNKVYVKLSTNQYLQCPCYSYSVGGEIRGTTSWHMISAVSTNNNPKNSDFNDYYCFESQTGMYYGKCNQYFDILRDVISADDFIWVASSSRYSVSDAQLKLNQLG